MTWQSLLNVARLGRSKSTAEELVSRSEFQRDFDRIVFSSAFRRMHGKTQVFPLPESDVTRTRLTHSLEVASVARSLGTLAGANLAAADHHVDGLGELAAAAALAHDLGNPPFGHSGEDAISGFFRSRNGERFLSGLSSEQKADFTSFEGNALGFRLLSRTRPLQSARPGGMRLTYATLAAFAKYPKPSLPVGRDKHASEKKFGFFQSEAGIFAEVAEQTGLIRKEEVQGWCRHPVAFLVEAADDICYRIIDFEDGYRLNLIPFDMIQKLLEEVISACGESINRDYVGQVKERQEQVGYLRARAINALIHAVAREFDANVDPIMAGRYDRSLLDGTGATGPLAEIKRATQEEIYTHRPVLQIEAAGFQVLGGLLTDFLSAAFELPRSKRSIKVLDLIPDIYKEDTLPRCSQYDVTMALVEYVASMTDTYAIDTYRTLRGIELPSY